MALKKHALTLQALTLLVPLIFLGGCADKTPQEALTLLEANQFSEAAALAKKALKDKPKDPFYHSVMAEVLTEQCIRSNCPASDPEKLDEIKKHLSFINKPISLPDETMLNIYARLTPIAERFISVHNDTKSYATFVRRALPEGANKRYFLQQIEIFAQKAMQRGDTQSAISLLENITQLGNENSPTVQLSKFILEFIRKNGITSPETQASVSTILENNPAEQAMFIKNIPHLALIKAKALSDDKQETLNIYTDLLQNPFGAMGLGNFSTEKNLEALADELLKLVDDSSFIGQFTAEGGAPSAQDAKLALLKVSLLHNTQNPQIWNDFFPLAIENTTPGDSLRFIYNNIDLTKIPANVVISNNELLVSKAQEALVKGLDVSPYLQEIIYRRDADQERFDKIARELLERGLDTALESKNYEQAVTYLRLMPEPPEEKREELLSTLRESLKVFWQENAFRRMEEITQYMRTNLNGSINLDVELMGFLRQYLESDSVKDKLRAVTPAPLLLSEEEAKVDLGPKMDYATKRFSQRPEIIQARLKALAINLEGPYSTANVLHSLRHLFTDENIDELVTGALKSAMVNDENLSAVEVATYGLDFMEKWLKHFTINFVVGESLKRIEDIQEAQEVWEQTNTAFHNFAEKLRPQLVNLLEGIRLFEEGKQAEAAGIFASITDPVYRKEAKPYLDQYDSLVKIFKGTYLYQGKASDSPVAVLYIKEGSELLKADITAISHLGFMEREQELIIDRGQVAEIALTANYDTGKRQLVVTDINDVVSGLSTNVARTFGTISHLTKQGETVVLHLTNGRAFPFVKANSNPGFAPLPQGRYIMTSTVHESGTTSPALPEGTIINFKTDRQTVRQDIDDPILNVVLTKSVLPVSGSIRHPATNEEISISGFFDKKTHLFHIEYTYPMNNGQTIYNALARCQPLEARITCAAHNRHEKRKRFMTVVSGRKVK